MLFAYRRSPLLVSHSMLCAIVGAWVCPLLDIHTAAYTGFVLRTVRSSIAILLELAKGL